MAQSTKGPQLRILFGGTFNPVHQGHLTIARWTQHSFPSSIIHFIPCHLPSHRQQPKTSSSHRLAMVELALANETNMIADPIEINQASTSYSVHTLKLMQQRYPHDHLAWLMGYDSWLKLASWYDYQSISKLAHVIIVKRAQYDEHNAYEHGMQQAYEPKDLYQQQHGYYYTLPETAPNIASSNIRHKLELGQTPLSDELPYAVLNYIQQNRLY